MTEFIVNIPVWHSYYITAETKEDALELAHKTSRPPDDITDVEDMCTEVNEEAIRGDHDYQGEAWKNTHKGQGNV